MPKMVVDSMLLITRAVIKENGVVPRSISVRVGGVGRTFYIDSIVEAACRISGKRRPKSNAKVKTVECLLTVAARVVSRYRKQSQYRRFIDGTAEGTIAMADDVLDLRKNGKPVDSMGASRLMSIAAGNGDAPSQSRAIAGLELARAMNLIIVDNAEASRRMQFYLAQHGIMTEVITNEQASKITQTESAVWSEPFVDCN